MNSLITFTYPVLLACLKNSSDDSEPENKSAVTLVGMIQRKVTCQIQGLSSHTYLDLSRARCFQLLADEIKFNCEVFYQIIMIYMYKYLHDSSIKLCLNTVTGNRLVTKS